MMNLEEIAQRIKNPFLCGSVDIDQLNQLSNKYPYSQAFSILYLKALSVNNDVRFDDELNQHAYKITDRMRLFELINEKEKVSVVEVEIEDKVEVESEIEVETEVEVELESKIEVEKEVKVVSELDILVDAVIKSEVEN